MDRTQSTDSNGTLNGSGSPQTSACLPSDHKSRTLVICFDGTGNQFNIQNSNVVEFFTLLKKDDPSKQMVYYQAGIGTYTIPQIITPFLTKVSETLDSALGWNLKSHIVGGYEFLMQNYAFGDKICIFGFSRGAYTARCLAGMIHKVGLLPICNHQQVPFAYKMYTRDNPEGWKQSNAFKTAFSIDVEIEMLGLWDSVSSVGLIGRTLPFASSNSIVRTFRHALALDEHRAKFKANQYRESSREEANRGITDQNRAAEGVEIKKTDVKEVWFSGCHSDIGGGSVGNGIKPCLARIPLRWMIRECFKTNTGIMFNTGGMKEIALDPASLSDKALTRPPAIPIDSSSTPKLCIADIPKKGTAPIITDDSTQTAGLKSATTEEEADLQDSLAPIYDQLSIKKIWWILELIPFSYTYQDLDVTWIKFRSWNLGRGRLVGRQESEVNLHRSVKTRMDAAYKNGQKYQPRVRGLDLKTVTWAD